MNSIKDQVDAKAEFNNWLDSENNQSKHFMIELENKICECNNFDLEIKSIQYQVEQIESKLNDNLKDFEFVNQQLKKLRN